MRWSKKLLKYPEIWILTVVALVTRLFQINLPQAVVFDETYFRTFAGNYLNGHYFFDIHPPFVKLLFAGVASAFGIRADQLIGDDPAVAVLRIIPALAGVALVPVIYIVIRQFGLGRRVATIGAALVLLDNALLVESRFILMDSILLLTGFGALSAYFAMRKATSYTRWAWTVVVAVLMAMLVSTKWSGLAVAGLIGLLWLIDGIRQRIDWRRLVGEFSIIVTVVAAVYISLFMVHFSLLPKSGEGNAFMSPKFQSLLKDGPVYDENARMAFWDKFVELNEEMYTAQSSLSDTTHPYASSWYTWPVQMRGVYYWQGPEANGYQGHIYMIGNPIVWWGTALSVVIALIIWVVRPKLLGKRHLLLVFLFVGYTVNFVPFAFIDRPMFLYHYLFALLFGILITCVLLAQLFDWQRKKYGKNAVIQTSIVILVAVTIGFIYLLPISYGFPLSQDDLTQRMLLSTWR